MRKRRILLQAANKRRYSLRAHQVYRRRVFVVAYKHPISRHTRKIRPFRIRVKTEDLRIETAAAFHFLRSGSNSNAVVVQFKYSDGHVR
jgi:hypothetical protein